MPEDAGCVCCVYGVSILGIDEDNQWFVSSLQGQISTLTTARDWFNRANRVPRNLYGTRPRCVVLPACLRGAIDAVVGCQLRRRSQINVLVEPGASSDASPATWLQHSARVALVVNFISVAPGTDRRLRNLPPRRGAAALKLEWNLPQRVRRNASGRL